MDTSSYCSISGALNTRSVTQQVFLDIQPTTFLLSRKANSEVVFRAPQNFQFAALQHASHTL